MILEIGAAIGLGMSVVGVACAARRLLFMNSPNVAVSGRVVAILPVTGPVPQLENLVRLLAAQTVRLSQLIIAVESEADPAFRRATEPAVSNALPIRIVVAGHARDQAQKCRNQQAALENVPPEADYLVMLDGDIEPHPDWLRSLLSPLTSRKFDIVTGHRWQMPVAGNLGAHVSAAIDRGVTLLPRLGYGFARAPWGGTMAMSVATARRMGLRACLSDTLSDDLSVGIRASERDLRIATRSALLVRSPVDYKLLEAWRFGRRQYQMCRLYRPVLWWLALTVMGLRSTGWICAALLAFSTSAALVPMEILLALNLVKQALVSLVGARAG